MAVVGNILKSLVKSSDRIQYRKPKSPIEAQHDELKKLLKSNKKTAFGKQYQFQSMLDSNKYTYDLFKNIVPIHDYNKIYDEWWNKVENGEKSITSVGEVKYFALSSGTSGAPSKKIPVTKKMLRRIRRASYKQMLSLKNYDLPYSFYETQILGLGGTISFDEDNKRKFGDLSGIISSRIPQVISRYYKPDKQILREKNWDDRIQMMIEKAPKWDIGVIAGVPSWIQILLTEIIKTYNLESIHDIWPNLRFIVHGGVSFAPYRKSFDKFFSKEVDYFETYLASEGFLGFNHGSGTNLRLLTDNGIFFEFIPFTEDNFTNEGILKDHFEIYSVADVKEDVDYAVIISTCSGAWRYMIGDTISFLSKELLEFKITGRIKHSLNICGEHMSVDNMNEAITRTAEKLSVVIPEFTIIPILEDSNFGHHWYIGLESEDEISAELIKNNIDKVLCEINDDYKVERASALKQLIVDVIPSEVFYNFLNMQGKVGSQAKFPRVLRGEQAAEWQEFIQK